MILSCPRRLLLPFFFFNDTATTEIYTLSLHDALPIFTDSLLNSTSPRTMSWNLMGRSGIFSRIAADRKSTRLNSSHQIISYAVFCLKKKKEEYRDQNCDSPVQ